MTLPLGGGNAVWGLGRLGLTCKRVDELTS